MVYFYHLISKTLVLFIHLFRSQHNSVLYTPHCAARQAGRSRVKKGKTLHTLCECAEVHLTGTWPGAIVCSALPWALINTIILSLFHAPDSIWGQAVMQMVKALHYKPEGRGFDSRWCHWNITLT